MKVACLFFAIALASLIRAEEGEPVILPGHTLEYPKTDAKDLVELFKSYTDRVVHLSNEPESFRLFFVQRGPLTRPEVGKLLEIQLEVEGWKLEPDLEHKGQHKLVRHELPDYPEDIADQVEEVLVKQVSNADRVSLKAGQKVEFPRASGLDIAGMIWDYSRQRVILSKSARLSEFTFNQAGPLTNGEVYKLLRNTIRSGGFALIPVEGISNTVKFVEVDREKVAQNKKKRRKRIRRLRYVPKPKK